jgi:fatty-acid peroxygenase
MNRSIEQSGKPMPKGPIDSTLHFLRRPYDFVSAVCSRSGSDMFETRLLLRRTVCLRGEAAAEMFYDKTRMSRDGAMPEPVRATLTGKGGVQGLDGERHLRRKEMFVSLLTQERIDALGQKFEEAWLAQLPAWARASQIVFYEALPPLLTEAVCDWAGVPLPAEERIKRTRDLVLLFDRAAALGFGHFKARRARSRSESWLARVIRDVRDRRLDPSADSALAVIAAHRDEDGALLSPRIAAVELLNVLRPTVAASVYITLLAHALHSFPDVAPAPASDRSELRRFVQEVRRFYPFFPAVAARSRKGFRWRNIRFPAGRRFLLDLHATNTDPHLWKEPETFDPERFRKEDFSAFALIPQGGGDVSANHRCPGETVVLEVMERALRILLCEMECRLPAQDLLIDRSRMPALPGSKIILADIRRSERSVKET